MSEPEDVLLDGAHHATLFVQRLWRRHLGTEPQAELRLVDVRGRLELFVRAAFGADLTIGVAEPPPPLSLFARLGRRIPKHLADRRALPSTDGARIRLPRSLPADPDEAAALSHYRLLAAETAARAARGTAGFLPADALTRDLFLIREAIEVDGFLASELPGLLPHLRAARAAERAARPGIELMTARERMVEDALVAALTADPRSRLRNDGPDASRAWAEAEAERIRSHAGPYRGVPAVSIWGLITSPTDAPVRRTMAGTPDDTEAARKQKISFMMRRPRVRQPADDEDDDNVGIWMIQLDDPQEHVEDPMGLQRPTDRDDEVDPDDLADSLSELPEARLVTSPGRPAEILASDDPPPTGIADVQRGPSRHGFVYPEWDYRTGAYHARGAIVHERVPPLGDAAWAERVLAERAGLLRIVRRRFERLRPRRHRLGRQLDGEEIDLSAYVSSFADRRAGLSPDGRLYEAIRPARRDVAIALLVDVSGSTDSWVTEQLRVVDVEKEALLVVCSALDALGDPYTILAFSGEGPEHVSLLSLKGFDERPGMHIHRRIAALEPDRYTRMGAALRHATARLMQKPARHRLLLLLSDGKPNDVDLYEGRYGVEDARQAVAEARMQGLHPFCVTVDRHAPAYMPRIFGAGGYSVLHHPEHLPGVLVEVLRRLVRA